MKRNVAAMILRYEPDCLQLAVMQVLLDRYLHIQNQGYPYSIIRDKKLKSSCDVLEEKARQCFVWDLALFLDSSNCTLKRIMKLPRR